MLHRVVRAVQAGGRGRGLCGSGVAQGSGVDACDGFGQLARPIADIRLDTPSTARTVHLNAAGASPPPAPVLDAHIAHLQLEAEIGG